MSKTQSACTLHGMEERQRLMIDVLGLLNSSDDLNSLIRKLLLLIKAAMKVDAAGLRVRSGDDFPYYVSDGYSEDFLRKENFLCAKDNAGNIVRGTDGVPVLECTCGLVLSGRTDPNLPICTRGGSIWTNEASKLLELKPEDDPRTNPRNNCIHEGYESVAIIPLRSDGQIVGALHLCNRAGGCFSLEIIEFLEGVAASIAVALRRIQVADLLKDTETTFGAIFNASNDGMFVVDVETRRLVMWNPACLSMLGYKSEEFRKLGVPELHLPEDMPKVAAEIGRAVGGAGDVRGDVRFVRKDGSLIVADLSSVAVRLGGRNSILVAFRDITERLRMDREREAIVEILRLINGRNQTHELIQGVTLYLQQWSGCEAVGIRMKSGDDYPYFETRGFPSEFVEAENTLCLRDAAGQVQRDDIGNPILECMCGNILQGRFDPKKPFFTEHGSFWSNCTTELLASTTEADHQARTRNRCNGEGYESVALIPLRYGVETIGLIQLNDKRKNRFAPGFIPSVERLADNLAVALVQRRDANVLRDSSQKMTKQLEELRRWQAVMFDREARVMELKKEVNGLLKKQGGKPKYGSVA